MVLRQRLLTLAPRQATSTAIDRLLYSVPMLETAETMTRAFELIMAGLRAVPSCSIDAVQSLIPVTLEPATLCKLQHHFQQIRARIEEVKQHIAATLDIIIDQLKLVSPNGAVSTTDVCTPGPVLMTWMRDACIAPALKAKLSAELADLRPPPSQQSDTVHDLVDPSLYCSVVGRTKYEDVLPTADGKTTKYATPAMQMRATMDMKPTSDVYTRSRKDTKYGWLPCEIHVPDSETVTTTILTYINNLHPDTYASLYKSIEQLFSQCVPVFENVLSSLDHKADKRLLKALYHRSGGKQCQVIVRIREIQLTPECPTFGGDDWHDEGTETEQVIATGVVFYRVENLTESRFTCRTFVKCPRDGTHDKFTIGLEYGLYNDELVAQELGQITAVEDRCIVVPNLYQYKLEPFGLKDPMRPGTLGMLTFLLVAPPPMAEPIISTASVPPQQAHWIEQERTRLLTQWGLPECAGMLVAEFARDGMTDEEAQHIRRDVVAKRTLTWESTDYLSFLLSEKGKYFWIKGAIPSREDVRAARQRHAMDFRYR